jgi:superfamily II DNA/RNA helicase
MVDISKIQYVVIDETDGVLTKGFYEYITYILSHSQK